MAEQRILWSEANGLCTLTLNRPDKLNALDTAAFDELDAHLATLEGQTDTVGCVVLRANGKAFPRSGDVARLYMPMGGNGPVFAVLANFDVIKRYNNSDSYALGVGHLADRILGSPGFVSPWPRDTALTEADRKQVQALLLRHGYQIGTPDGVIGPKTRAAVIDWQGRSGLLPDGYVSGNLLRALS